MAIIIVIISRITDHYFEIGPDDCWICYDPVREDAGPIIQPCFCKGDVRNVHHNCLLNWLIEVCCVYQFMNTIQIKFFSSINNTFYFRLLL